jgi:uncharacterized protein (UPF0333 family)
MALVAKRNQKFYQKGSEQGQISIFFSASLMVFISIIAFVINVGLFVKAKINLQNATDASAWAGAAVQARQLTKIAYLNWEMRNVYKEWMYKYYVVGNLNAPGVEDASKFSGCPDGKCTNFRLANTDPNILSGLVTTDAFNFPATCIHIAGSQTNVCKRFAVPGLPEFGGINMPGSEDLSRQFMDVVIGSKINDCVSRSRLNMLVTTTWAYNVLANNMDDTLVGQGPAILSDRQGAWPKALEIGMRIRNLEKVMNKEARPDSVCSDSGASNCTAISAVSGENLLGNERIVKAFYSGYRNLGNESDNEMKASFKLTELQPNKYAPGTYSSSNLLIPAAKVYEKQYVDLKLMMVNLATFYAALIPRSDSVTSGSCDISKVAIPIPGYPLGFFKNPDVLTYYAVKGEADFVGMFNPFSSDSIKLTAYAAAKPAGGRIGPMLFMQSPSQQEIYARKEPNKFRSGPYISSLDVVGTPNKFSASGVLDPGKFSPGAPLPINVGSADEAFWLTDVNQPVGGQPSGTKIQFGIPNLVYDFANSAMSATDYTYQANALYKIISSVPEPNGDRPVGLYNHDLFLKFKGNISGAVTSEDLAAQVSRVRAPTLYEAANYLIPTPNDLNARLGVDSFGSIPSEGTPNAKVSGLKSYDAAFYAPLYKGDLDQSDLLYLTSDEVFSTIIEFMRLQKPAVENYIVSLNYAANQTYITGKDNATVAAVGARELYKNAAMKISDIDDVTDPDPAKLKAARPKSCDSLAGSFWYFYYGYSDFGYLSSFSTASCPSTNLGSLFQKYLSSSGSISDFDPTYYRMNYNLYEANFDGKIEKIYSAYMPGPYNGVGIDGVLSPPGGFPGQREKMRRNFYSTKLITLDSVQRGGIYDENIVNFATYSEGNLTRSSAGDGIQNSFVNALDPSAVPANLKIRH